ncbi:MAG: hypothetical protein KF691_03395 [Phycisphaeraceae bacterium]|nr:hypothetical protein [Phycisphaeraceae bacterium]
MDVSGDGRIVLGRTYIAYIANASQTIGLLWSIGNIEPLFGLSGGWFAMPETLSSDGSTAVGTLRFYSPTPPTPTRAATWTQGQGGFLPALAGLTETRATACSHYADVIVGSVGSFTQLDRPAIWRRSGIEILTLPPDAISGVATSVSGDGSVVAGAVTTSTAVKPFIYSSTQGVRVISGYAFRTVISGNGAVMIGMFDPPSGTRRGFIWTPRMGYMDLYEYALAAGVDLSYIKSMVPVDISHDGTSIAGYLTHNGGIRAFRLSQLRPWDLCPADLNADSVVDDADFVIFVAAYDTLLCASETMAVGCPSDLNGDAAVDDVDFVLFANAYDALRCL